MIIWLASYPKSGNTYVRAFLSAYYFSESGEFEFSQISKIDQFPHEKFFREKFKIPENSCFHQFVILVKGRKKFLSYLKKNKIPYGFHYPYTIHKTKAFKSYCVDKNFTNSLIIANQSVSIPMDPLLNKKQIKFVVKKINSF